MFDSLSDQVSSLSSSNPKRPIAFRLFKRIFDLTISIVLLPLLGGCALAISVLNPWFNRGPLIYQQLRMGRHCQPFTAYKFRSMRCASDIRHVNDPVEHNRITKLGRILRKSRIDELPQIINVLKGEMSLIGPRPDFFHHAKVFLDDVPGYRARHSVRPGISGLAQTEIGYVQGPVETRRKVLADLYYIHNPGFLLEAWIVWRTLCTICGRKGV